MNNRIRPRHLLLWGLCISLLIHLLIIMSLHWPQVHPRPKPQVSTTSLRVEKAQPRPRPRATPRVLPSAPPKRAHRAPHPVRKQSALGTDRRAAPSRPTPTPAPIPSASPSGSACLHANAVAALLVAPPPPALSPDLRAQAVSGTAAITVQLDAHAKVRSARVTRSTGNAALDGVVLAMAQAATYTPSYRACVAVAGSYDFRVKFVAW